MISLRWARGCGGGIDVWVGMGGWWEIGWQTRALFAAGIEGWGGGTVEDEVEVRGGLGVREAAAEGLARGVFGAVFEAGGLGVAGGEFGAEA